MICSDNLIFGFWYYTVVLGKRIFGQKYVLTLNVKFLNGVFITDNYKSKEGYTKLINNVYDLQSSVIHVIYILSYTFNKKMRINSKL